MKILVVDDSLIIRNKVQRCFGNQHTYFFAENGQQALEVFCSICPDFVTMDLTMPNMDGVESIRRLIEINSEANILVISALSDKITALEAIKNGAKGFVAKPFQQDELQRALQLIFAEENI